MHKKILYYENHNGKIIHILSEFVRKQKLKFKLGCNNKILELTSFDHIPGITTSVNLFHLQNFNSF